MEIDNFLVTSYKFLQNERNKQYYAFTDSLLELNIKLQ